MTIRKSTEKEDKKAESEESSRASLNAEYFIKMPKDERKKLISAAVRLTTSIFRSVKPKRLLSFRKAGSVRPFPYGTNSRSGMEP